MTDKNKRLGVLGETAAASHLETLGITVLETNFRSRAAEIDIIAKDGDTLCFIEVKTRTTTRKGLPREAVTDSKQQKILLGAQIYLKQKKITQTRIRFDVIEVMKQDRDLGINLIKNAFQAG